MSRFILAPQHGRGRPLQRQRGRVQPPHQVSCDWRRRGHVTPCSPLIGPPQRRALLHLLGGHRQAPGRGVAGQVRSREVTGGQVTRSRPQVGPGQPGRLPQLLLRLGRRKSLQLDHSQDGTLVLYCTVLYCIFSNCIVLYCRYNDTLLINFILLYCSIVLYCILLYF